RAARPASRQWGRTDWFRAGCAPAPPKRPRPPR
nr:hypothetical protein [Tanacetum cinerariifolium]